MVLHDKSLGATTMIRLTPKLLSLLVCIVLALTAHSAFAQDDEGERIRERERQMEEAERQRQEEEQQRLIQQRREEFVNSDRENAKKSVEAFSRPISRVEREFMQAVPQFRQAVTTYRDAIGAEGALKESVKGLDRFVDLFKEYFKVTHVDLPAIDKTEFSTFSKKDLVWETLTTAERIDADLRLAVKHLEEANSTNTLSIETVIFMRDLHGDVLRLEMLLSKVK